MKKYIYISITFLAIPFFKALASWTDGLTAASGFGLSAQTPEDILTNFLLWLTAVLAILTALALVVSGIMFLFSGGNPDLAKQAKDYVKYSIIGLSVSLSAYIIIKFISDILTGYYF
jgi:hypothetical protein